MRRAIVSVLLAVAGSAAAQPSVRDDYGRMVTLPAPAARVVSLSPHLTELVYAAGAGATLVGAVEYSDYPPQALALPRVGSDAGIDLEAVLALRPDLIVAWPNAGSLRAIERLEGLGLEVFRSEPRSLEDIPHTLERLGRLAGTETAAAVAASAFHARATRLEGRYAHRPSVRVFYQIWDRPLITINGEHVISKVLRLCGGRNVFADLPLIAPQIDREAVLRADPEAIVTSSSAPDSTAMLQAWRGFSGLTAVAHDNLFAIPPDLIQRHTPRLLDGAERLCAILEQARARRRG